MDDAEAHSREEVASGILLVAAAICGAVGVILGAFGAHALDAMLAASGRTATWDTAVLYHLMHSTAAVGVALVSLTGRGGMWARRAGWCWLLGIALFSGSLYAVAVGAPGQVAAIAPVGGLAYILGWLLLVPTSVSLVCRKAGRSMK